MNYNLENKKQKNSGYTIIETMIAVAIFTIIVTIGMSALVNANLLYNKSKDMRSIMDSLSYTMDDLSRNLRTGSNYYCIPSGQNPVAPGYTSSYIPPYTPPNGTACVGIEFTPSGGGNPWAYEIATTNGGAQYFIEKAVYNGTSWPWMQMTPAEVYIDQFNAFSVFGAPIGSADNQQPLVNIRFVGHINYKGANTSFSLQTSVSQRQSDI